MGGETGNLVTETLAGDDGDFGGEALVGLEIQSQTGVVLFNKNLGSPLNSLGTNAALLAHVVVDVIDMMIKE